MGDLRFTQCRLLHPLEVEKLALYRVNCVQSRRFLDLDVLDADDDWQTPCLLTDREQEILELVVDGCNNATIANHLYITVGTVKTHIRSILKKLCARDRTDAAVKALRSGLVA